VLVKAPGGVSQEFILFHETSFSRLPP
jgi:hypothetical protein